MDIDRKAFLTAAIFATIIRLGATGILFAAVSEVTTAWLQYAMLFISSVYVTITIYQVSRAIKVLTFLKNQVD